MPHPEGPDTRIFHTLPDPAVLDSRCSIFVTDNPMILRDYSGITLHPGLSWLTSRDASSYVPGGESLRIGWGLILTFWVTFATDSNPLIYCLFLKDFANRTGEGEAHKAYVSGAGRIGGPLIAYIATNTKV